MNKVGYGTFPLANVFNKITSDEAKLAIRTFIDNGGYYIDTAPLYGFGDVEKLMSQVLKDYARESYYIITKCGYIDVEGKSFQTVQKSCKYDDVMRECERSLARLQCDYIDLYLVHSWDKKTPFAETMEALVKLKQQGKIKEIGVSNVNLTELQGFNYQGNVKFVQNRFNAISRSIDTKLADYLIDNEIKMIPYHVLELGLLTGKVFENVGEVADTDLRKSLKYWQPAQLSLVMQWVQQEFAPIAKELGITIGQLAIAWVLAQKFVDFAIVGSTNPKFIQINLQASDIKLSADVLEVIDAAYQRLSDKVKIEYGLSLREFRGFNEKYY